METSPLSKQKSKKRASHSKVKTGCLTCKIRRIKCDETKPECLRCLRFEGHCDGYPPQKASLCRSGEQSPEYLHPKSPRKLVPLARKYDETFTRSLETSIKFRNEQEHLAFLSFRDLTTDNGGCGYYPTSLWHLILQACQKDDFIRDAVVAFGALMTCTRKLVKDARNRTAREPIRSTPRYEFALRQYGHAVKKLRLKAAGGEEALRSVLIGCILVVCFEAWLGNHMKALAHALGGHSILRSWLTSQQQSTSISSRSKEMTSPAEHIIENELVQAMSRLDLQVVMYTVDPRPAQVHKELHTEGTKTLYEMPSAFSDLIEARNYLDLVQQSEQYHEFGMVKVAFPRFKNRAEISLTEWGALVDIEDDYLLHSRELLRWQEAFKPLWSSFPESSKLWKRSALLQIQSMTTTIGLQSALIRTEDCWDRFIPDFQRVMTLSNQVFDDEFLQNFHGFSFDGGVIKPFWMIANYCREPTIRRDAIAMLRKIAAQELFWDGLLHASGCEEHMLAEEEAIDENGFIPQSERFRIVGGSVDGVKRIGTIIYRKYGPKEDGSVDERTFTCDF